NRIRELREQAGLRQADLAEHVGIGVTTLWRYETTHHGGISAAMKQKIAVALDATVEEVFPLSARQTPHDMSRRQLLVAVGAISTAFSLAQVANVGQDAFEVQKNRQSLGKDEIRSLIDDNYALWELFNTLQIGSSLDSITAIAQGK